MSDMNSDLLARLFVECRDTLSRYVRRLVRSHDTADEIVQEAFLRTYERGDAVRVPRAFLFTTARNLVCDFRRRNVEEALKDDTELTDSHETGAAADDLFIADEATRILKQGIELLPPQCLAVVALRVFQGYSHKEIGIALGLSRKTVEKHLAKGMLRVHEYVRARYVGGHDG